MIDKRILVTGSRKGIGREIAEYYLKQGSIVYGCSRSESDLKHKNYRHFFCNVSSEEDVKKMFREIRKDKRGLDALINNAGMASMNHYLLTPLSTVDKLFKTNFFGTFLCSREAAKIMQKKKKGRIINLSTVAVPLNLDGEAIYASSKSAVELFTKTISKELGSLGITVNALGPTPIKTDLIAGVPKSKIEELLSQQAIHRFGEIRDVINVMNFFLSDESDFITGQIIYFGGVFK